MKHSFHSQLVTHVITKLLTYFSRGMTKISILKLAKYRSTLIGTGKNYTHVQTYIVYLTNGVKMNSQLVIYVWAPFSALLVHSPYSLNNGMKWIENA